MKSIRDLKKNLTVMMEEVNDDKTQEKLLPHYFAVRNAIEELEVARKLIAIARKRTDGAGFSGWKEGCECVPCLYEKTFAEYEDLIRKEREGG